MEYDDYRKVFSSIDELFWSIAVAHNQDGWLILTSQQLEMLEDAKKIITSYVNISIDRMQKILTDDSFSTLPLTR